MQQGSLQEEMEALSQVRKAVAESAKRHVMVYTSDMALQEQVMCEHQDGQPGC